MSRFSVHLFADAATGAASIPGAFCCRVCGSLALLREGFDHANILMEAGKPLAVVVYLALSPKRRANRDHVAELFWPGTPISDARHSLRQSLYRLRNSADGYDLIRSINHDLELDTAVELDCLAGERALSGGDAETALELLSGDFLEGFVIPESREFESWAEAQRARFRRMWSEAAFRVADHRLRAHEPTRALELAEQLAVRLPFDDGPTMLCMAALAALGRHATGLARFHAFAELLRKEEEGEPAEELAAYARELEAFVRSRPEPVPSALPFVGRSDQWTVLETAWNRAREGQGTAVLIEGMPGLGKTRLLEELSARVAAGGGLLLSAKCYEIEQPEPYAAAVEVLRGISGSPELVGAGPACLAEASRLIPELGEGLVSLSPQPNSAGPHAARRRLHHALARCLEAIATQRAVVLALDDLQWADDESLTLIHYLIHRLRKTGVLILGAFRPQELTPAALRFTRAVCGDGLADLVVLDPLTRADLSELLEELGRFDHGAADTVTGHLHRHTGGNPLFIAETLDALERSSVLSVKDGQWRLSGERPLEDLPRTLGALIDERVARLPPWVRSCVEALAVGGPELQVESIARALRMSEPRIELACGVLMEERLARRVGASRYEMAHDELRRLVWEQIPESQREQLLTALNRSREQETNGVPRSERHTSEVGQSTKATTNNLEAHGLWLEEMGLGPPSRQGVDAQPAGTVPREQPPAAALQPQLPHTWGKKRVRTLLGAGLAAVIGVLIVARSQTSAPLPWRLDVGGTYFNPKRGLEGTAFLSDPVYHNAPRHVVFITGPSGWNGDSTFECYPTLAPQVPAARRAICWTLSAPPISGSYQAVSVVGRDTLRGRFSIDASISLGPPTIQDLSLDPDGIRVRWDAPPGAQSFVVRLSGLPFGGTLTESLVAGTARRATLARQILEHGRDYQVTVFALGVDITTPGPTPGQFNVSVTDWRVRYDSAAMTLHRAGPGDPLRR